MDLSMKTWKHIYGEYDGQRFDELALPIPSLLGATSSPSASECIANEHGISLVEGKLH